MKTGFMRTLQLSLNALGTRYNSEFNVTTTLNQYLDLFSCNENAIRLINSKKPEAIKTIKSHRWKYNENRHFIDSLCRFIKNLDDVTISTISDCFDWSNRIKSEFSNDFARITDKLNSKCKELDECESRKEKQKIKREICIYRNYVNLIWFWNLSKLRKIL